MSRGVAALFLKTVLLGLLIPVFLHLEPQELSAQPVEIKFAPTNYIQLHLTGERQIKCTSKYHNVDLKVPYTSAFMLNASHFYLLTPDAKVKPGDAWTADAFAVRLSDLVHRTKAFQPANPADKAAYDRWTGTSLREKHWEPSGQLEVKLLEVSASNAVLQFSGILGGLDTGKMSSRYGPNNWRKTSQLKFAGKLVVQLDSGQVTDLSVTGEGDVDGVYYTSNSSAGDDFKAKISLKTISVEKLDGDNFEEATRLIDQLGDTRYRFREKASRLLEQLGPSVRMLLEDARQNNEDLEIRVRAARVIETFPKPPPMESNETPPDEVLP